MAGLVSVVALRVGIACGSSDGSGLDGPVMRHTAAFSGDFEAAQIGGVLRIEGDCLYLTSDARDRYPIVWPHSSSWDSDAQSVLLSSGEFVGDGDRVLGGGGFHTLEDVRRVAGDAAAELAGLCVANRFSEVAIVNNEDGEIRPD
jgi:hypothetical protein